tara:strand:+ start:5994 stop:6467 length:474 start_codon:yes stop_codon:yes gene_type:complete
LHNLIETRIADAVVNIHRPTHRVVRVGGAGVAGVGLEVNGGSVLPGCRQAGSAFTLPGVHIVLAIFTLCADVGGGGGNGGRICSRPAGITERGVRLDRIVSRRTRGAGVGVVSTISGGRISGVADTGKWASRSTPTLGVGRAGYTVFATICSIQFIV